MQPMMSARRPGVVVRRKRLLPAQRGCGGVHGYSAESRGKWVRLTNPGGGTVRIRSKDAHAPVGFQNSATGPDLRSYAARSYSLMRPPRMGRRLVRFRERSATGWSGAGGQSCRLRCGRPRRPNRQGQRPPPGHAVRHHRSDKPRRRRAGPPAARGQGVRDRRARAPATSLPALPRQATRSFRR